MILTLKGTGIPGLSAVLVHFLVYVSASVMP